MSESTSTSWRLVVRRRLVVCAAGMALWTCAIEAKLVYLQLYQHEDLQARADRQRLRTLSPSPKRGDFLDRNGHILAYSVDVDSIYAVPTEIADAAGTASRICEALDGCSPSERGALTERMSRQRPFAWVRRKVSPAEAGRVADLKLDGIGFLKESRRFYPKRELAAPLVGFVGLDNTGLGGLEATYDKQIRGKEGRVLIQTDGWHQAFSRVERPATAGATIELTIDEYLQHIAERELRAGVSANRAAGGVAVVMDPHSGEILALANEPTFNPHEFASASPARRRNRAVQDVYEPGSTFKVVTASAALEELVVGLDDPVDVSGGRIQFGAGDVVSDTSDHGVLSFTDVIVKSSNVGAIKIGLRLGPERLSRYVRRFGFGARLSRDFPAEAPGILWDAGQLTPRGLGSMSMGYQIGVTPLQMAAAVSSVANGGSLMEPRVVRAIIQNGHRARVEHRRIRTTISRQTSAQLTGIMEAVVARGTGTRAQVPGYPVAGKTGTAAKLVSGAGGKLRYSTSEYNASFIGFVPSRRPVLAIVVVIDSPSSGRSYSGSTHTGGAVAAPVFERIAEASLRHLGVAAVVNAPPPVLVDRTPRGPEMPTSWPATAPSILTAEAAGDLSVLPDFRGLSAREVVSALTVRGMTVRLRGEGFVVEQNPPPGSPVEPGGVCIVRLARRPPRSQTGSSARLDDWRPRTGDIGPGRAPGSAAVRP